MSNKICYNIYVGVATHLAQSADRDRNRRQVFVGVAPVIQQGAFAGPISLSAEGAASTRACLFCV
jgi:hypothetical protein